MEETEPMAWNAAKDQSMGRPSRNASAVMAQTAFVGVSVRRFTRAHTLYSGTPPSRRSSTAFCAQWRHQARRQQMLRGRHMLMAQTGQKAQAHKCWTTEAVLTGSMHAHNGQQCPQTWLDR